jgi:hypothetical protein
LVPRNGVAARRSSLVYLASRADVSFSGCEPPARDGVPAQRITGRPPVDLALVRVGAVRSGEE